jgi:hypothetical protein
MQAYVLLGCLVLVVLVDRWLADRKDRRHDAQVNRLLHWRHDPAHAALMDVPSAEALYLPPEDDKAWNDHHRTAD